MAHDPRAQLAERSTSVPISGPRRRADRRAGDGNVEHAARQHDALRELQRLLAASAARCARGGAPASPPSSARLASQVSCAASFSRLCWVAASLMAKPPSNSRTTAPSMPPIWSKKATTRSPSLHRNRRHGDGGAAGRNVDQLAGMLLLVLAHEAAEQRQAMRLWRRRSGTLRVSRPGGRRAKVVGCRTSEPCASRRCPRVEPAALREHGPRLAKVPATMRGGS